MDQGWTKERVALALRLFLRERLTAAEVAAVLGGGLTRGAVISKVRRLGYGKRVGRDGSPCDAGGLGSPLGAKIRGRGRAPQPRLPPERPAQSLPPLREVTAPNAAPARLADLEPWQCRWPLDDPGPARMHLARFCGAPARRDVYCEAHRAIAGARPRTDANRLWSYLRRFA